ALPPPATYPLSLHDALPISRRSPRSRDDLHAANPPFEDQRRNADQHDHNRQRHEPGRLIPKRHAEDGVADLREVVAKRNPRHLRSEEHTSELQSLAYLVCRL